MADLLELRKVPPIRKIPTLLRLYWLDGAIVALQKNAFTIRLFPQGKSPL
jgi:hypothetical protein